MLFVVMAAPSEFGCVTHFCNKSDGVLLEIGPKRLESITNCINEWLFTTNGSERTLSNHAKQARIQIGQKIHDACLRKITHTVLGRKHLE